MALHYRTLGPQQTVLKFMECYNRDGLIERALCRLDGTETRQDLPSRFISHSLSQRYGPDEIRKAISGLEKTGTVRTYYEDSEELIVSLYNTNGKRLTENPSPA